MPTIKIYKKDYEFCESAAKNYWANKKNGFFGKGILTTKKDPYKVVRTGLLGELAVSHYLGRKADFSYKEGGEKCDLILKDGRSIDVKTASRNYGAVCIRCRSASGRDVLSKEKMCDIYIACYVQIDDQENKQAKIKIVGWQTKEDILKLPIKKARVGRHKNYELEFGVLKKIEELKNI